MNTISMFANQEYDKRNLENYVKRMTRKKFEELTDKIVHDALKTLVGCEMDECISVMGSAFLSIIYFFATKSEQTFSELANEVMEDMKDYINDNKKETDQPPYKPIAKA